MTTQDKTKQIKDIESVVEEFDKKFPAHSYRENQSLRPELKDFIRQSLISYATSLIYELEGMREKLPTTEEYKKMNLSEMCTVRCDLANNEAFAHAQDIIRKSVSK